MPVNYYEPIRLSQTNRYAGYQFYCRVRKDGTDGFSTFRYVILTVFSWMLERIPAEDRPAPELQLPGPEKCAEADPEAFRPYHFSVGYALDITPLMYEGLWAMRLKEPDGGTADRPAVPQRFFTTRIGIRLDEKGYTELAIRIDVTDPASVQEEVPFAFRPGFVRKLFAEPSVHMEQVQELLYDKAVQVKTEDDYRKMIYLLESEDNQLPLAVFTYFRPGEKKRASPVTMEEFVKGDLMKSVMQFAGIPGKAFPGSSAGSGIAAGPDPGSAVFPAGRPVLLHDADAFCGKVFAYAVTFALGDSFTERFRNRIRKDFSCGDILLCGPRKFRGGVAVFSCNGESGEERKKAFSDAVTAARKYSKHKAPYSFGKTVFEAEARKMEQLRRYREIVESTKYAEKEKVDRLTHEMNLLFETVDNKDKEIGKLNARVNEAFERGTEFRNREYAALEEENAGLRKELKGKQEQIDRMRESFRQAGLLSEALEKMRTIRSLPESNAEVVSYFRVTYPDRIGFTQRGAAEASKCGLRPATLWNVLYTVANGVTDVFREKQGNLTEEDIIKVCGCEVSFREGSMTRKDSDQMKLRDDEFEGTAISVEPHMKLKTSKGEPAHQRLHFCYMPELKRVIIGYIGDHLESAATKYAK